MSTHAGTDPGAARGHSSATLYEAALSVWRRAAGEQEFPPAVVVDPTIRAAWPGARVAGPAFTVRGVGGDNLALHRAVAAAAAGHVLVADLGGAARGHWGEVLAVAAQSRGLLGLVIDGGVRDRDEMRDLGFPVFSRGDCVLGTAKCAPGDLGAPLLLGGAVVRSGDLVVGDTDGVVVLPRERVAAVLNEADRRVAHEREVLEGLRAGRTTLELYGLVVEAG